jgi:hypothetical protein
MTQTQNPCSPLPATVDVIVARYIEIVGINDAAQNVLIALNDPMESTEIIYELCDTARDLGYFPAMNMDAWWASFRDALPAIRLALTA